MGGKPNHSRHDAGSRQSLDQQRASGKVLRKPLGTQFREQQRAYEDDREAHAGDRVHNRGMREANGIKDEKRSHAVDEAIDEVPELAARCRFFRMLEYLASPLWANQQRERRYTSSKGEKNVAGNEIGFFENNSLQHVDEPKQSRRERHGNNHPTEVHLLGKEHEKSASGEQAKCDHFSAREWLIEKEIADHGSGHRAETADSGE